MVLSVYVVVLSVYVVVLSVSLNNNNNEGGLIVVMRLSLSCIADFKTIILANFLFVFFCLSLISTWLLLCIHSKDA